MRSTFKDKDYFDFAITYNSSSLARFRRKIAEETTTNLHRKRLLYSIYNRSLDLVISMYSRGDAIEELIQPFQETVAVLGTYLAHGKEGAISDEFEYLGQYLHSLWMVSLGVLLDVEDSLFLKLVQLLANNGRDRIYEFIVGSRIKGRDLSAPLMHPKQFSELAEALNAAESTRPKLIHTFLTHYYDRMSELAWHGTHLHSDPRFCGYWSFEAAVVVKLLGGSDDLFRNNIYYPSDLVHWKSSS